MLVGLALCSYPFVSNYLMSLNYESEIAEQEAAVEKSDESTIKQAFKQAETYNKNLLGTVILKDPFDPNFVPETDLVYEELLNLNNDSIMGSIEIPKIDVKIPIFHGTSQEVLLKGVGHLTNTSLPIGGKSTHAVLTGHTGVPNAVFFTDLDKLEKGDMFFIRVLNRTLAYKVDQIKVVLPTVTKDLLIADDKDYVTLITCTPYGINSHRLLVRGTRVPYTETEIEKKKESIEKVESTWMSEYKRALIIGAAVFSAIVAVFVVFRILILKQRKRKKVS
ncbi:MAG: class C sortase [Ruminococcus sp.]|nr:class C sortase [Ruminococcus sp.]